MAQILCLIDHQGHLSPFRVLRLNEFPQIEYQFGLALFERFKTKFGKNRLQNLDIGQLGVGNPCDCNVIRKFV